MDEVDRKARVLAGKKLLAEQMLKRKSKAKKKKKAKTSGNVSTDVESSFLDDSSAVNDSVNDSVNDGTGANALENSHFAPNHDGKDLKNDAVPHNPLVDGDLQNFIDQLDAIDTDQSGNWEDPYDRTHPQDGHASQRLSLSPQPFVNSHPPHVPDSTTNSVTTTGSGEQPPENSLMPTNRRHHHAPSSLSDHFSSGTESSTLPSESFASAIPGNNDFPYENSTHNALSGFLPNHSTQSVNHTGITTSNSGNNSPLENSSIPTNHSTLDLELRMKNSQDTIAQLQNEVITLQNERKLAQNELNLLRENQSELLQRCRREYEQKLANLQQELIDKEHQMQSLELKVSEGERERRELEETRSMEVSQHEQKLAHMLSEHEKMHAEMLSERDRRHAEELARVRAESANAMPTSSIQSPTVGGGEMEQDSTELEAERIRIIKQTLNDLHEAEKTEMKVEHGKEMERLRADLQKQCDAIYQNAVTSANSQLQELYAQYSAANTNLEGQKKSLEATVERKNEEIARWQNLAETAERERLTSEEQYQQLLESKSAEIRIVRENSMSLETQLKDWTEKAALLEANMAKSEDYSRQEMEAKSGEQEEAFTRATADFESRISALQSQVETWKVKLHQAELKHQEELGNSVTRLREENSAQIEEINKSNQRKVQEMVMDYEDRLSRMKDEHSSQLNTLETSLNERTSEVDLLQSEHKTEKGSLEVAEERMMELQGQLKEYRNQERSFDARISDLNRQHEEDLRVLRGQLEAEITKLEKQLVEKSDVAQLESDLKAKDEILHRMAASHKEEIDKLQLRASKELEGVMSDHQAEMEKWEQAQEEIKDQIDTQLQEKVKEQYKSQVASLKDALSQAEKTFFAKYEQQIGELKSTISKLTSEGENLKSHQRDLLSELELAHRQKTELTESLQRKEQEKKQLAQDCDRFQNKSKNLEVELSISKSAEEQNKLAMERAREQDQITLQDCQEALAAKEDELVKKEDEFVKMCAELESIQSEVAKLGKEKQGEELELQQVIDQLAAKSKSLAELQAENDDLKTSIDTLSRKQSEYYDECVKLQSQLESSWGVNEELESLKDKVAELTPYRDTFEANQLKIERLQHAVQAKEESEALLRENEAGLKGSLETASRSLQERTEEISCLEEALAESRQKAEGLENDVARLLGNEDVLKEEMATLESKNHTLIQERQQALDELQSKLTSNISEMDEMRSAISDLQSQVDLLTSRDESLVEELAEKEQALETLQSKLTETMTSGESELTEINQVVIDLQSRLAASDADLAKKSHAIESMTQNLEENDLLKTEADFSRSPLESTFSRARQNLTEMLQEKADIEKELGIRRAHLERQEAEKQYLEDLLLEKKRFEQELQRQKNDLLSELQVLEGKMSLGSSRDSSTKGGSLPNSILSSEGSKINAWNLFSMNTLKEIPTTIHNFFLSH